MRTRRFLSVILGLAIVAWSSGLALMPISTKAATNSDKGSAQDTFFGSPDDLRRARFDSPDAENAAMEKQIKMLQEDQAQQSGSSDPIGPQGTIGATSISGSPTVAETFIQATSTVALKDQASDAAGHICSVYLDTRDGAAPSAIGSIYARCSLDNGASWLAEKRLDDVSGTGKSGDSMSITSDGAGAFYVFFDSFKASSTAEIMVAVSRDGGKTWSGPILIDTVTIPYLPFTGVALPNGQVHVVWTNFVLFFTTIEFSMSSDFGSTWTARKTISDTAGAELGPIIEVSKPCAASVYWTSNRFNSSFDDLVYSRTTDCGATWSANSRVNTSIAEGTDDVYNYDICSDGHGSVYASYMMSDAALYVRKSTDNSATFAAPTLIGTLDGPFGEYSLNCSFGAGLNRAVVGFEGHPTDSDVASVRTSTDGGATWTAAARINPNHAINGPEIQDMTTGIDSTGGVVVAWTQESASGSGFYSLYVNHSSNSGSTWASSEIKVSTPAIGTHSVSLTGDRRDGGAVEENPGEGASNNDRLVFHLTWSDTRAGAIGMYYGKLTFAGTKTGLVRLSGLNRVLTGIEISKNGFPTAASVDALVLATSQNFPDGLAAGPLAAMVGGPVLLNPQANIDPNVLAEIARVFDGRADTGVDVYVIGGPAAISDTVIAAIDVLTNVDVLRVSGSNRIKTAKAVAERMDVLRGRGPSAAIVANSANFPDALAASAPASDKAVNADLMPILLNPAGSLDGDVSAYLSASTATLKTVNVVGGGLVVTDAVKNAIDAVIDTVNRLSGANRNATAVAIASFFYTGALAPQSMGIATGLAFADALTGGRHSGLMHEPLLLVTPTSIPGATTGYISGNASTIDGGFIYGGTSAVSEGVRTSLESLY